MGRTVFLRGCKLDLVLLTTEDADTLQGFMNDHGVTQYLGRGEWPMHHKDELSWIESLPQEGHLVLGIWHQEDRQLIGSCGLHGIDHIHQLAELGIVIGNKDYWNGGLGTEAVILLCQHGFNWLNLRHITLRVLGNNARGQRCYERCGFKYMGSFPMHFLKNGVWHDEVHMLCTRDTFCVSPQTELKERVSHMVKRSL